MLSGSPVMLESQHHTAALLTLSHALQDLQEAFDSCAWLPVAPGWTEHFAPGIQQPFYFHQATGRKQWQRPAAVETELVSPFRNYPQSAVTLASQAAQQLSRPASHASEQLDNSLEAASVRLQHCSSKSETRSAVSCPCDASDACAAVFDIRCREGKRNGKRGFEEDVTSKLASLDVSDGRIALFDSASELEPARTGQDRLLHDKLNQMRPAQPITHSMPKRNLRRSSSCQWTSRELKLALKS